jgi:hypothetical protein
MNNRSSTIIECVWSYCSILRDNGIFSPYGDGIESVVVASVARAGRLRQSVLKSAFEGRLG